MRQILHEIDDKITPGDLDLMIEEIDADGSGKSYFCKFFNFLPNIFFVDSPTITGTVDFEGEYKKNLCHWCIFQ